jgi:hypothetical protein
MSYTGNTIVRLRNRPRWSPQPSTWPDELVTMLYFSLSTLTTAGYGDIVPVDPFARTPAKLKAVLGQFYLTIATARHVRLGLADRRR